jgi:hypothetical protein
MSATLSPATLHAARPELRAVEVAHAADPAERELHRWLTRLGTPFVLGAVFFALSIATPAEWLIGVSLALGPMLFLFSTIYLCITSDTNGAPELPVAQDVTMAEERAAA